MKRFLIPRAAGAHALATMVMLALAVTLLPAQSNTGERFTAFAVNLDSAPLRPGAGQIEIVVNRYSPEAEATRLVDTLLKSGPDELLAELQDLPRIGYIRTPGSLGYDLHFARKVPDEEGGERIVIVTDRYINFWEARNRPRTIDYPFTVIEMHLNKGGEGEGKLSLFTKIKADKKNNTIVLENYGTQPVLLKSVKRAALSN
jgi:hypothetical protein